jgi:hypothetical protein
MMKKFWIIVLALFLVPVLAFAQYDTLKLNLDYASFSYFGSWGANAEGYVKLVPTSAQFRMDSVKILLYRAATTVAQTLNIRVEVFSPNGTPAGGTCGCTTGPGTLLHQYPSASGTYACNFGTGVTGFKWFSFLVPHDTLTGTFVMGIKYVSIAGPGTTYPSILFSTNASLLTCCDQYWNYQSAPGVRDNEAMFTTTPGPQYIEAKGNRIGAAAPGHLTLGTLEGMGGALLDSTVTDTLVLGNSGGTALTVLSVVSSSPAYTTDPLGTFTINSGQMRKLAVHYTPTVAGPDTTTLTFTDNVPGLQVSTKTLWGRGIAHTNVLIYENWWNANGAWPIYRFGNDTSAAQWGLYYSGAHSDDFCNLALGHPYTATGVPPVDDVVLTPFLMAPASHNIRVDWREQTLYPTFVVWHGLVVADSDTNVYVLDSLALANATQDWADYPTTWYISGIDSAFSRFEVGFEYAGTDADIWYLDDINVSDVPQLPPVISGAEPHGDAFTSAHQLYCNVFDPNNDPFTVTAHVTPFGGAEGLFNLTETPAASGHYCIEFTSFLSGAGSYSYYLTAQDAFGSSRWPESGNYTFEVQSMSGATELIHHDGVWNNAHYYNNMGDMDAERFTPPSYPFLLTGAKVGILNGWPDYTHQQIQVRVYADDGAGGLPGTLLYDQVTGSISRDCAGFPDTTYTNHYDEVVFFPSGLTINSGTFYIAVKNPDGAVAPATEGWTLDTLGNGTTYYYNAGTSTWSLQPDSTGGLMTSAIGFVAPAAPHLAAYPNAGNTALLVYDAAVSGGSGPLPFPMNLYVRTTWTGTPTLVSGSPFTTSPITYVPTSNLAFFTGTYLYGGLNLSTEIPGTMPVLSTSSLVPSAPSGIRVASAADAVRWNSKSTMPVRTTEYVPSVVVRNSVTGESVVVPFSIKRGKPTSKATLDMNPLHVGPTRPAVKGGGFEIQRVF